MRVLEFTLMWKFLGRLSNVEWRKTRSRCSKTVKVLWNISCGMWPSSRNKHLVEDSMRSKSCCDVSLSIRLPDSRTRSAMAIFLLISPRTVNTVSISKAMQSRSTRTHFVVALLCTIVENYFFMYLSTCTPCWTITRSRQVQYVFTVQAFTKSISFTVGAFTGVHIAHINVLVNKLSARTCISYHEAVHVFTSHSFTDHPYMLLHHTRVHGLLYAHGNPWTSWCTDWEQDTNRSLAGRRILLLMTRDR